MSQFLKLFFLLLCLSSNNGFSQPLGKLYMGAGVGLDYGGYGTQLSYLPIQRIEIFGAFGYNLDSFGNNIGTKLNFSSHKRFSWHLTAMYGYNAVLSVKGVANGNTTYFGPSVGAGISLKPIRLGSSFVSIELIYPFRNELFYNAIDEIRMIGYEVKAPNKIIFSIGYHFYLSKLFSNELIHEN